MSWKISAEEIFIGLPTRRSSCVYSVSSSDSAQDKYVTTASYK